MNNITIQHYTGSARNPKYHHQETITVPSIRITYADLHSAAAIATTTTGEQIPISKIHTAGINERWTTCISDTSGERWS